MSRATETAEVKLGGRTFDVSAFTFDQLQQMMPLFDRLHLNAKAAEAKAFDLSKASAFDLSDVQPTTIEDSRAIIKAALSSQIEPGDLAELRTNLVEIFSAVAIIAKTSGLVAVGEMVRGMATPAATAR
jgi:hypothetical protein